MKKTVFLCAAAAALCVACGPAKKGGEPEPEHKYLVLYYSQTGNTEEVAEDIAELVYAEAVSFDVETPYNGTFDETIERCLAEQQADTLSPLMPLDIDLDDYDVIFLGYPVWFGTYARPVASLLKELDFSGKTIVPFCTFGSGGLSSSVNDLRAALPEATVTDGFGIRAARIDKAAAEVERFLIVNDYMDGDVEELPDYSAQQPVTEAETAIFQTACGDYPMPIGTPVSFGTRVTPEGTDYLFTVSTKNPEGQDGTATVYITCPAGGTPEFTSVER
ncbi:MAG: hypothetical protein LUC23_06370 [Prevotellaceae bacterium]|nr:hypothetical protein [Prevotellaceae bacterium]